MQNNYRKPILYLEDILQANNTTATLTVIKQSKIEEIYKTPQRVKIVAVISISSGVPQGSELSPFLFNICVNDLPKSNNICLYLYADDLTISATSFSPDVAITKLNKYSLELHNWCQDWRLNINPNKCAHMEYKKRTKKKATIPVTFNNIPISTLAQLHTVIQLLITQREICDKMVLNLLFWLETVCLTNEKRSMRWKRYKQASGRPTCSLPAPASPTSPTSANRSSEPRGFSNQEVSAEVLPIEGSVKACLLEACMDREEEEVREIAAAEGPTKESPKGSSTETVGDKAFGCRGGGEMATTAAAAAVDDV
ncbi:hypothetical protein J437_LFUL014066 [Ladona fulva]|uniref:Reverse transcriptase domain-containing protein n=1 Tax=Ladona fulva TaxID=123851 RepID=A0A8K0P6V5_LADFU|nr:hypothetical protein J437_LFUL014066 [Ladona fulva]